MKFLQEYIPFLKKDMLKVLQYIPSAFIVGLLISFMVLAVCRVLHKKWTWRSSFILFLLVCYGMMVLEIAFFSRAPGSRIGVTLGIGDTWGSTPRDQTYVIENVLMYLPFGILFSLFGRRATFWCIPVAFFSSILLEVIQWMSQRGYAQIDDVIANTLGAILGCLIRIFFLNIFFRERPTRRGSLK